MGRSLKLVHPKFFRQLSKLAPAPAPAPFCPWTVRDGKLTGGENANAASKDIMYSKKHLIPYCTYEATRSRFRATF
jgi:hypothetical protein